MGLLQDNNTLNMLFRILPNLSSKLSYHEAKYAFLCLYSLGFKHNHISVDFLTFTTTLQSIVLGYPYQRLNYIIGAREGTFL